MSGTNAPTTMMRKDGDVRTKRGSTGDCVRGGEKQLSESVTVVYRDYCRCSCGCEIELDPTQRGPTRLT